MFATVRRYEGIDSSNIDELTKKVGETLAPKLSQLPGFSTRSSRTSFRIRRR